MLSDKDKREIYDAVMESVQPVFRKFLNELNFETVQRAQRAIADRNREIIDAVNTTSTTSSMGADWKVDPEKFKKYLATIKNPKQRERLIRLYKEGQLEKYLARQQHYFATFANNNLEWFRDNTDISLSPEFFDGAYSDGYKNTDRKPTKDEHDFYRFYNSFGEDTEGMSPENIERYKEAFCRFYKETMGVDPSVMMP